jgi:DNA-binding Lrp family transcriptional regulator
MATNNVSSPETADRVLEAIRRTPTTSFLDLATDLGIGHTTAWTAVRRLLADGRIQITRKGTSRDYPTQYRVTEDQES